MTRCKRIIQNYHNRGNTKRCSNDALYGDYCYYHSNESEEIKHVKVKESIYIKLKEIKDKSKEENHTSITYSDVLEELLNNGSGSVGNE